MEFGNWFSGNGNSINTGDDFKFSTEDDKVKRRRAIADLLRNQATQPRQGQFIRSGDFTGYAGGNTGLSALTQGLIALMANGAGNDADKMQGDLDRTSSQKLAERLASLNDKVDVPYNAARDSQAANTIAGGEQVPATIEDSGAQTIPLPDRGQVTATPLPSQATPSAAPSGASRLAAAITGKSKAPAPAPGLGALLREPQSQQQIGERLDLARAAHRDALQSLQTWGSIQRSKDPQGFEQAKSYEARTRASLQALEAKWQGSLSPDQLAGKTDIPAPRSADTRTALTGMLSAAAPQATPQPAPQMPQNAPQAPMAPPAMPQQPQPVQAQPAPPMAPQQAAGQMPAPAQAATNPIAQANPGQRDPTQAEMLTRYQQLAQTGPDGARLADAMMQSALSSKNGRFKTEVHADPVNGGFIQVVTDSQTGQTAFRPLASGSEGGKVLETKEGPDGRLLERTSQGWREATMNGKPVTTAAGEKANDEREAKRVDAFKSLNDMKSQRDRMTELVPLIQKVGTGRLQTPWNDFRAYFTDSKDLDKMNRAFNQQQLEGAVQWLKGQGSVTEGERALLANSQFNPKADTQANVEYANMVLGMLNKHIPLAEAQYQSQYGGGGSTSKPNTAFMYSWQRK